MFTFVYILLTTHPPQFVNVNCERPQSRPAPNNEDPAVVGDSFKKASNVFQGKVDSETEESDTIPDVDNRNKDTGCINKIKTCRVSCKRIKVHTFYALMTFMPLFGKE